MYAEQIRLLYANVPSGSVATLLNSSILTFILWKVVEPAILISWLACLFLVTSARYLLVLGYRRASPGITGARRWGVRLFAMIGAVGIVWGSAGFLLFPAESIPYQAFLAFVLGGMIAGALGNYSVIRGAFLSFALPASLPLLIHFFILGSRLEMAMGGMAALFVAIMIVTARQVHGAIMRSLELQLENTGLIADLTAARETAEKSSEGLRVEIAERERSKETLRRHEKLERLINTISTKFINIQADELDGGINRALKWIGEAVEADRSYLFLFDMDRMTMDNTHEWCAGGIEPQIDNLKGIPFNTLPWWMKQLNQLDNIHIPKVADLPPAAEATEAVLRAQNIQSLIVVPLIFQNSLIGFLGFDSVRQERSWPEETISLLRVVGEIFASALKRRGAEERIVYLSQIAEQMGEMVIVTGLNHVITYANAAVEQILGYKPEEIMGRDSRDFFKDVPGNPPDLARWIEAQKVSGTWRGDIFNRKKDGSIIKVHLSLSPLKDGAGRIFGYVGISMDITEHEKLEKELRQAQKMEAIGTLAGGLAHDFNNLLSGIIGFASLAKMGLPQGSPFISDMEEIEDLTQRGAALTKSLLTLARRGDFRPEPLKINRIIEEVLKVVRVSLKKNFRVVTELSPDIPNIIGDRGQLHQVIMNLCLNARDAMERGGILTFKTSNAEPDRKFFAAHPTLNKGDYVAVTISDTGIGMDSATRARIFDPFFTTKADKSGTGLGLAMVQGIVDKHGGFIEVESELGRGSAFTLYLPATAEKIPAAKHRPTKELRGTETIMIVDDEKEFRVSTARWLRGLGYTVIEAESGEEALKALAKKQYRIELVVLDIVMKGMGGAETFDKMRKIVPDLPVIISSAYPFDKKIQRLFKSGARAFLRKPYKPEKLAAAIRQEMGKEMGSNLST